MNAPVLGDHRVDQRLAVFRADQAAGVSGGRGARSSQRGYGRLHLGRRASGDGETGALGGKSARDRPPDAARPADDEGDSILEPTHGSFSFAAVPLNAEGDVVNHLYIIYQASILARPTAVRRRAEARTGP